MKTNWGKESNNNTNKLKGA